MLKFRTPDPDHVYDIFGKYSCEEASVVRTSVIDYITCDLISFNWMVVVFTMLHLNIDEWLLRTKNPNSPTDEAVVYGLCQLYSRHTLAYMTGSVWSTLEIHGKCSLEEVKRHCDVHLVFLEGGVLGQLHRKPSVPRLMSVSTIPSKASATVSTQNDAPVKVTTDHTYSPPTPKPMQGSSLEAKPASDHTYAEYSDTPTEPYGSDAEHTLDSVSTGVTKEGWLIVASTDRLEISVEYSSSTTLLEATGMSQNASEMLLDASNAGIVRASPNKSVHLPLPDKTADHEALLEATMAPEPQNGSLPDKTQWLLPNEYNQTIPVSADVNKTLQEATDATDHSIVQLTDKTSNVLSDDTRPNSTGLPEETAAAKNRTSSSSESPDTSEDLPLKGIEQPDHDGGITEKNNTLTDITNQGSVSSEKPDNTTTELTNSLAEHDETKSATTPSVPNLDVIAQPCQN